LRNAANKSIPAGRKIAFAIIHNTTKVVNMYLSKLKLKYYSVCLKTT